eukprot:TRINITY_DN67065_c0_g1_i1.p1 TRINITY_DN67065_c0_g1~~TRINITY_DN67065_c0_g1_i1.p1  ORF type:complete len:387 (+),score=48.38 TRINITY_DN67065_c0_g1_i1:161-1321(+)
MGQTGSGCCTTTGHLHILSDARFSRAEPSAPSPETAAWLVSACSPRDLPPLQPPRPLWRHAARPCSAEAVPETCGTASEDAGPAGRSSNAECTNSADARCGAAASRESTVSPGRRRSNTESTNGGDGRRGATSTNGTGASRGRRSPSAEGTNGVDGQYGAAASNETGASVSTAASVDRDADRRRRAAAMKAGGIKSKAARIQHHEEHEEGAVSEDEVGQCTESTETVKASDQVTSPKNVFDTLTSQASFASIGPFTTLDYDDMTKQQRHEARALMKDFVKTMVRGRQISVVAANGGLRACFCSLDRKLEKMKISITENDTRTRDVLLSDIRQITPGEGKADELLVTLSLHTDQNLTFQLSSADDRDSLVTCLTMLSSKQNNGEKRS